MIRSRFKDKSKSNPDFFISKLTLYFSLVSGIQSTCSYWKVFAGGNCIVKETSSDFMMQNLLFSDRLLNPLSKLFSVDSDEIFSI